ncbi:hypothetical protein DUI87_14309 [Hirundo rustica rustica]|uniref:Methenyltetrahydrofolate synthase domain-containing protein n=1 Tax=Hirundo rustica rustica TaxID=333673 RepID=A0A3M0K9T3_HIRRU|nr:hypothetical protein DUI87_14309 [Hirundo rustica rustica]
MAGPARPLPALPSKWDIREKVWEHLEASGLAEFPRPVRGRIPNFKGSLQACSSLGELDVFSRAREVKVDPDKPLEGARLAALQARKTLLVPTPRLRTGLFNRIVPPPGASKEILRRCATSQGVKDYSVPVGLDGKAQVDLVVVGSVAVSEKGWRIGKGEGYADMEYAMMVSMGAVREDTPVVTIVHDCQVSSEMLGKIPILRTLRSRERQAGKDVTLQDEHPALANTNRAAISDEKATAANSHVESDPINPKSQGSDHNHHSGLSLGGNALRAELARSQRSRGQGEISRHKEGLKESFGAASSPGAQHRKDLELLDRVQRRHQDEQRDGAALLGGEVETAGGGAAAKGTAPAPPSPTGIIRDHRDHPRPTGIVPNPPGSSENPRPGSSEIIRPPGSSETTGIVPGIVPNPPGSSETTVIPRPPGSDHRSSRSETTGIVPNPPGSSETTGIVPNPPGSSRTHRDRPRPPGSSRTHRDHPEPTGIIRDRTGIIRDHRDRPELTGIVRIPSGSSETTGIIPNPPGSSRTHRDHLEPTGIIRDHRDRPDHPTGIIQHTRDHPDPTGII